MRRHKLLAGLLLTLALAPIAGGQEPVAPLLDPDHPTWSEAAPERFRVRFRTGEGDFVLEVFRRWAPLGVDRLYNLVRLGFYDDTRVYRVRDGVFAQFGLSGDPAVNRVWYERRIPDDPPRRPNLRGTVSFAMLEEPDTRTTQLFVNLRDNPDYDAGGFAPLGRIIEGMEVVDRFHAGYGEEAGGGMRGGRQGRIVAEGNAHLDAEFPLLTRIEEARIEPGEVLRYPDVGANRIRAEVHLLPAVSTGPLDPSWSPDGTRLAFSMRGDIWVVDTAGGEATAVTRGPAYHFEPSWSPDGAWIAFSRDLDGNLDVGVVAADGGEPVLLTAHPHVDVQPAWSADGRHVYLASARGGGFDLYRAPFAGSESAAERLEPVVGGPGHQIQPAVSPDGGTLAFVSPVAGRLGTGGLWTLPLASAAPAGTALERARLVHHEETSYRAEPAWTPDGRGLVFVSDAAGSNDLAAVPAAGGSVARLTRDDADELDPAVSPDGSRIAFVSNRSGPTRLVLIDAGGGRRQDWARVAVERLRPLAVTGELAVRVRDADSGEPLVSRLQVLASDERGYAPEGGFHRVISATDIHYFHTDGDASVSVPAGPVQVEAWRGPEYLPVRRRVDVAAGERTEITLELERLVDMPAAGHLAGDTHSHDLHQGRYGLSHEDYFRQLVAEDLHVTNALIHMDGTRVMGRWDDLTGEPHPLSTPAHLLQYGQEFRGSFGHVGLLGIFEFAMPLIGGTGGTVFAADVLNADWLDAAHEQGGIGGYMHPYSREVEEPEDAALSEIALDVALGKGDFYDVVNYPYDDLVNARMYWRFLNAGFRLPATGGSDNFADVWRDAPPGSARTYARIDGEPGEPVRLQAWLGAVRAGRTLATNGPLLSLRVAPADPQGAVAEAADARPGDTLTLEPQATADLRVTVDVASVAPLERVEILVNGAAAAIVDARGRERTFRVERTIQVPGSAWVAALAVGPAARAVTDGYPFAHTSPVYVVRGGEPYADPAAARFLADVVRAWWQRLLERDRFPDAAARERYRQVVEEAIRVYEGIASGR